MHHLLGAMQYRQALNPLNEQLWRNIVSLILDLQMPSCNQNLKLIRYSNVALSSSKL